MNKSYINIHHTAMYAKNDSDAQFSAVDQAHKKRWEGKTKSSLGYYGGYHYLIERNGEVKQYRKDSEVGAHNDKSLMNYRAIGICLAGNMSEQMLTEAQIKALVELVETKKKEYGIVDENIQPHRHYKGTQCPGNNLPDKVWDYIKEQAEKLVEYVEPSIVTWHKNNKIIEYWNTPATEAELKLGWSVYKGLKALSERGSDLKFDVN